MTATYATIENAFAAIGHALHHVTLSAYGENFPHVCEIHVPDLSIHFATSMALRSK